MNAQHIQPKGNPLTALVGGAIAWNVKKGDSVTRYQPMGVVDDRGLETEITAPLAGKVSAIMVATGAEVKAGEVIAYIAPDAPKTPVATATPSHTAQPQMTLLRAPESPVSPSVPSVRRGGHIAPSAQSNVPLVAQLVEFPPVEKVKKGKPKKTKNRTYSIGEHQESGVAKLAKRLQLDALEDDTVPSVNESELVRAAVDMLLALPRPALLDVIRANKEREKAGAFGIGRPRPLKT